jgi:Rne/Rng family ribonuclease
MSKEMVISANRHETRVALLEDDQLVEVHFQRAHEYSLAGSIHKGRVTRVLPGMQSAFVDLGLERDTFLYVSDFLEEHDEDIDPVTGGERPARDRGDRGRDRERRQALPPQAAPPRQALPPQVMPQPAPAVALAEDAPETAPASETSAPAALAAPDRPAAAVRSDARTDVRGDVRNDGRNDDRRGRRSRRRRNRGRGIPESKYAETSGTSSEAETSSEAGTSSETGLSSEAAAPSELAAPSVAAAEREPAPLLAPLVLPGESLRKYRSAPEPEAPPTALEIASPESAPLPSEDNEEIEFEVEGVDEYNLPVHYPPENALPDAPIHHPVPAATGAIEVAEIEGGGMEVIGSSMPGVEAPPAAAFETVKPAGGVRGGQFQTNEHHYRTDEHQAQAHRADAESGPAIASLLDEDEDLDIQAMILGEVEGMVEELEIEGQEAGDETEELSASLVEPGVGSGAEPGVESDPGVAPAEPESGAAEVRERGGRYPHRVSRRGRRRPRGGSPEGRPEEARPQEGRTQEGRTQEGRTQEGRTQEGSRSDVHAETPAPPQPQERTVARPAGRGPSPQPSTQATGQPSISDLLKEGQEIIVQIAKEPLGQKGARITSHIALPGRYVVYMPTLEHMGVSRKIASDEERLRLKRILQGRRPGTGGGFITRTAAEGRSEEEIAADMEFLYKLWQDIKTKAERKPAPLLLHHDLDIVQRVLRDQLTDSFKSIWIDNEEMYENIMSFVQRFQPGLVGKVKLYTREAPIFDAFGITQELEKALRPKVWLKSGGYIVINQTEALVAIDVNTGKYVGKSNRLEDTIVKTNTEAIKEIVRQIRLRDLGGIIVIDFIDMDERKNRQKVMQVLEEAMRVDRAPYKILQFNDFGLVAITRKRVKQSLERTLCSPCPHCDGGGYIKSVTTVVGEILTEARKMASSVQGKEVVLRTHPDVAKVLKSNQNKYLEELEEVLRRPVLIKSDPLLHNEKFDLA